MWKAEASAAGQPYRSALFELTDSVIAVVFIATVASISGVYILSLTAGVLSMAVALPSFGSFLAVIDSIKKSDANDPDMVEAGAAFLLIATMLTCVCCITIASQKTALASAGYEVISG
jgi:hypothetical protein